MTENKETKFYAVTVTHMINNNQYVFIIESSGKYIPEYSTTSQNIYMERFNVKSLEECYKFIHDYSNFVNCFNVQIINKNTFEENYRKEEMNYNLN